MTLCRIENINPCLHVMSTMPMVGMHKEDRRLTALWFVIIPYRLGEGFMIPCCFHPTRVVIVNDHLELLMNLLGGNLPRSMTFDSFSTSRQALHYINEVYQPEPFYDRYIVTKGEEGQPGNRTMGAQVVDTHYEIYRPQRFDEISTVVMDYSPIFNNSCLPSEMTGLEFFEKLKNPHIQKILLIEEGDEQMATQALNKGLIHHYVCKQDPHCEEELYEALQNAQWQYFNKLSEVFIKTIRPVNFANYPFVDPNFQKFFKAILLNYGFTEAYLCESTGSYLFLDDQAQDHGLVVNIAEQLDIWARSGQAKGVNFPLLKALKNRKKMMCYHTRSGSLEPDKSHWEIYAHPAKTLRGQRSTFYYAFAPNMYDIDVERILPFEEYRENQQKRMGRLH